MKKIAIIDPASYTLPYDYYYIKSLDINAAGIDFYASYKQEHLLDYLNSFQKMPYCNLKIYNISRANKVAGLIQYFVMLIHITKNYQKYEYIHFQWSIFYPMEVVFFFLLRKKLVFSFHNPVPHNKKQGPYLPFKIIYKLCAKAIFLSHYSKETFLNFNEIKDDQKYTVIPHPDIPISPHYVLVPKVPFKIEKTIIFWGNVKPYKGVEFFEALAKSEMFSEYKFEIHGKWDPTLKVLKHKMEKEPRIKINDSFLDHEEVYSLMKRNLTFLLPYTHGSQSGVLHTLKFYNKRFLCTQVGEQASEAPRNLFNRNKLDDLYEKIIALEKAEL